MSTKEELKVRLDDALEFAEKAYKDSGSLYMTVDIQYRQKNQELTSLVMVFGDEKMLDKRFEVMKKMGMTMATYFQKQQILGVDNVLVFSEAWVSKQDKPKEDEKPMMPIARPSEERSSHG